MEWHFIDVHKEFLKDICYDLFHFRIELNALNKVDLLVSRSVGGCSTTRSRVGMVRNAENSFPSLPSIIRIFLDVSPQRESLGPNASSCMFKIRLSN